MSEPAKTSRPHVVPCLRYRRATAAIEWLGRVFGFAPQLVVPGEGDTVAHAQLRLGDGMIMLGSVVDSEFGRRIAQPDEIGGRETQCCYVVVPDADAVLARAKAAGAGIWSPIRDEEHGGRGFGCSDLEGHLWYVGTYDPFADGERR